MDACTSKAIPFQDWTRNALGPNARSRAGSLTARNWFAATPRNSCAMLNGQSIRCLPMIVASP